MLCLDNLDTGSLQNIEHLRDDAFAVPQRGLRRAGIDVAESVDYVFHLASPASPIDYLRLPLHTLKVGSYGTHNALGLAKFKRARFLLASTSEVYGDPLVHPQPESYWGNVNPIGPRGVYDESKRYGEALTMAYHRQQGVDTCIARIFNTYGPRMRPNDGRAVPNFVRQALAGKPLTVFGDGTQTRSLLLRRRPDGGPLPPGDERRARAREPGQPDGAHADRAGRGDHRVDGQQSEIVYSALPIDDPKVRQPDITRATELLGWQPSVTLGEGLANVIAFESDNRSHSLTALQQ